MSKTQYIILKERIAKDSSRSGIVFVFELVCLVFGMLYFFELITGSFKLVTESVGLSA